jgi:3-oxoacyl-[acyl-carrier protein] reductase
MIDLTGKVLLITGAARGIGAACARAAVRCGADVVIHDVLAGPARELAAELGNRSHLIIADLADPATVPGLWAEAAAWRGRIDVLVNGAAIEKRTPVGAADGLALYREIFATNVFGLVAGTLAVLPGMLVRRSGIVVNVSSDAARAPEGGQSAYSASKAAVSVFSESVAHEVADRGVHVHVLYPAWVPTAMGLSGVRAGEPMPPKPVRRTEEQVSRLLLERMGGPRMEINAARLPLAAPIARTLLPRPYQQAMRRRAAVRRRGRT